VPKIAYWGPHDYTIEQLVERLKTETPEYFSVDTETISLKDRSLIGVGIGLNQQEAVYFPVLPETSPHLNLLWRLLSLPSVKVFHNSLYDLIALSDYWAEQTGESPIVESNGLYIGPVQTGSRIQPCIADTSIMGQVQGLPNIKLAEMSASYLGWQIDEIADILPARHNMLDLETEVVARKCLHDCLATMRLFYKMDGPKWWDEDGHTWNYEPSLYLGFDPTEPASYYVSSQMKDCYQTDMRLAPLLMKMSWRGMAIRQPELRYWYDHYSKAKLVYEDICSKEGFNPASPQQVGYILASRGNFLPFTRTGRQLKTDDEALSALPDPLAAVVLSYRKVAKLKSTYLEPWLDAERAYTHFRQDLSTMRLASFGRNLQNIPPEIRNIFAPDNGVWSVTDANEIEMRIFAYITKDPVMLAAYANGSSVHTDTQLALWPGSDPDDKAARLPAKTFGFAMVFNASIETLASHTKLPLKTCKRFREIWMMRYNVAADWMATQMEEAPYRGWQESLFGRRMRLPAIGAANFEHIQKCALNYIPQGSAADIVKRGMLMCEELGMDIALQVHDEILVDGSVEFPKELAHICPGLETPFKSYQSPVWR